MEILKNEKTGANTVVLEIKVGAEEFDAACNAAFKKNGKNITVPGFRKGKATRKMIEKMYGESVFYEDAVNESYPAAYEAAVKEAGITPVAHPELEILSIDGSEGYTFKATITVKPEVTLGDYKAIKVEKVIDEVTEDEVMNDIKNMAQRNARIETVDREAKEGDVAVIDYDGYLDGVQFDGGKAEGHELKLGSGQFIPGFEEQVAGHKAGEEFDVNVSFPEKYHAEDLAGKAVTFKCKLHEVKETILPEIDDEFAKDVSEFDTLEALKEDARAKLVKTKENVAEQAFESAVIGKLVDMMEAEIPDAMVESKTDSLVEDFAYRLQMQGIELSQYLQMTGTEMADFRKNFSDRASQQVKVTLALEKLAELEGVEVSDEDIEAEYAKLAGEHMTVEQVKMYINAENMRSDLKIEKALNNLKAMAIA